MKSSVAFDCETNTWRPSSDCSSNIMPLQPTAVMRLWSHKRRQLENICRDSSNVPLLVDGMMIGQDRHPQLPQNCPICQLPTAPILQSTSPVHELRLRTYSGTITQKIFEAVCICGHRFSWNPGDECIHTINNGKDGGKSQRKN